jgi:hypothetical protein
MAVRDSSREGCARLDWNLETGRSLPAAMVRVDGKRGIMRI